MIFSFQTWHKPPRSSNWGTVLLFSKFWHYRSDIFGRTTNNVKISKLSVLLVRPTMSKFSKKEYKRPSSWIYEPVPVSSREELLNFMWKGALYNNDMTADWVHADALSSSSSMRNFCKLANNEWHLDDLDFFVCTSRLLLKCSHPEIDRSNVYINLAHTKTFLVNNNNVLTLSVN